MYYVWSPPLYCDEAVWGGIKDSATFFMTKQNSGNLLFSSRDMMSVEIFRSSSSDTKFPSLSNKMLRASWRLFFSKSQSKRRVSMSDCAWSSVACSHIFCHKTIGIDSVCAVNAEGSHTIIYVHAIHDVLRFVLYSRQNQWRMGADDKLYSRKCFTESCKN